MTSEIGVFSRAAWSRANHGWYFEWELLGILAVPLGYYSVDLLCFAVVSATQAANNRAVRPLY
jgi:hypothetical protein